MPFYAFTCPDCQENFELRRRIAERDESTQCPRCNGVNSSRKLSVPMAFSRSSDGAVRTIGGSPCSSCVATTCSSCSIN